MENKGWIVVTGASSGIGLQTVKQLMNLGYSIIATAKNEEKLKKALQDAEGTVEMIPWDLSDIQSIKVYAKKVNDRVGPISGLVHCAGIQKTLPIHMTNEKSILEVFQINTFAGIMLVSAFSKKGMYTDGNTSFVLISSISAQEGALGQTIYGASKGALDGFMKPAAAELVGKGIRINSIAPGAVKTEMWDSYIRNLTDEQLLEINENYPLGVGSSSDIANMIEYLIGDKSKWITGQIFVIDGGHLSRKV